MPDIQTALSKALEEGKRRFMSTTLDNWDAHEQTIRQPQTKPTQTTQEKAVEPLDLFKPTGNLSHDIFTYIKWGTWTGAEVAHAMVKHGYNKTSAFSIITQMKRCGMVRIEDGYLTMDPDATYTPIAKLLRKTKKKKIVIKLRPKAAPAPAPQAQPIVATTAPSQGIAALTAEVKTTWDADTVIANIGIKEAYKLYEELTKYFGRRG